MLIFAVPRIARAGTGVIGDPEKSYAETKLLRAVRNPLHFQA